MINKSVNMLILGTGKMTKAIAYDFVYNPNVKTITIAGRKRSEFNKLIKFLKSKKVKFAKLNLKNKTSLKNLMMRHDCAVSAIPYNYNYDLAKIAVDSKCNFVDLGGNNDIVKKEFTLHKKAKQKGIVLVPDSGLAPGLVSNLTALGIKEFKSLKEIQSIKLRVGGLPQHPKPPLNYMIVFSVNGLINEYVEPALVIQNYKIKKVNSMENIEKITFPKFKNLEAFTTSGGTSTLPQTFKGKIKSLDYKTIRYAGHAEKMQNLIKSNSRSQLENYLKSELSFKDKDLVLLKVVLESKKKKVTFTLIDKEQKGLTSMMRCTGFPAATIAEMIVNGDVKKKGVLRHEFDIPADILIKKLRKKGLDIRKRVSYHK